MDTLQLVDPAVAPLPPIPRGAGRKFYEFVLTGLGAADDLSVSMGEVGEIFRIPTRFLGKPLGRLFETIVHGWSGEWVFVTSSRLVREMFSQPPDAVCFETGKEFLRWAMGSNTPFLLGGSEHTTVRHALTPELTQASVEQYRQESIEVLDRMIDELPLGVPIRLQDLFTRFTQEMILRVTYGMRDQDQIDELRDCLNQAVRLSTDSELRMFGLVKFGLANPWSQKRDGIPWYLGPKAARLRARGDALIYDKINQFRRQPDGSCLGGRLIEKTGGDPFWTDKVLRDVFATLLLAGHDTSVSAYSWAADLLLHHPEAQARVVEEARSAVTDRYAQAANNEALRVKPPVWGLPIIPSRDLVIGGYRIRKGAIVFAPMGAIHNDPKAYPDPQSFRPERFLDKAPDRYEFVTFSQGRHRCPGISFYMMEANIVLHRLFGRLDMEPCGPPEKTYMAFFFFNRPTHGVQVVIKNRRPAGDVPCYQPMEQADLDRSVQTRAPDPEDFPKGGCPFTASQPSQESF